MATSELAFVDGDVRPPAKGAKLSLSGVRALVVDGDEHESAITTQMLRGFGLSHTTVVRNPREARTHMARNSIDLCIVEYNLAQSSGAELTRWIRRQAGQLRCAAVVIFTGHTRQTAVMDARDSGANSVVKKPISAEVLFDHIAWAATSRSFIETDTYIGPDRRFRNLGPPGSKGRRSTDLSGALGDAKEPNMSQNEIDGMMRPTKVII